MTRENGEIVRLSHSSLVAIAGVAIAFCVPIIAGLIAIKSDIAAVIATQTAQQRQIDRLEGRVK